MKRQLEELLFFFPQQVNFSFLALSLGHTKRDPNLEADRCQTSVLDLLCHGATPSLSTRGEITGKYETLA